MKTIPLTKGKSAIVDDSDFERVNAFKWYAHESRGKWYARRGGGGKYGSVKMHRFILDVPNNLDVDHINGNGLDNRRCNIRTCNKNQNQQNRQKQAYSCTSAYKGVTWSKSDKRWRVEIRLYGKRINIGSFTSEVEAAQAYDRRAKELFGEFARPNFQ